MNDLQSSTNSIENTNSKEEILTKAFKFHAQGNISEAEKYYHLLISKGFDDPGVLSNYGVILEEKGKIDKAINVFKRSISLFPNSPEAYCNLGSILQDQGKTKEAEIFTLKAIKLKPDSAEAYSNLGTILSDLGKPKDALIASRKAIELKPNYAEGYANIGIILIELNKLKEAEMATMQAIKLKPNFSIAHSNLGTILIELGKPREAFDCFLKAISITPKKTNNYSLITRCIKDINPEEINLKKLNYVLDILLKRNDIDHNELFGAFNYMHKKRFNKEPYQAFKISTNDELLCNALKKITLRSIEWEKSLSQLRKDLSHSIAFTSEGTKTITLDLLIALAEQCFLNEYIYCMTKKEHNAIDVIISKCKRGDLNERYISLLACYYPLYKLIKTIPLLKSFKSSNPNFNNLLQLQVIEPLEEVSLSKTIQKLGSIKDEISIAVKSQYEQYPYPRWRYGNPSKIKKITVIKAINHSIKPNSIIHNIGSEKLKILIAGCGTGKHILNVQKYKNSQVTAIDLSSSSLAYAQRKINELDIKNVDLIQMDILDVALLRDQFDVIECSGVLHHMADPLEGLDALLSVLKKNGLLNLALYSELARKDIVEVRRYIDKIQMKIDDNFIRDFREDIFSGKLKRFNSLVLFPDFFSTSEFLDLCLHTQEHRFTINELADILISKKLRFLGFLLPKNKKSLYQQHFPEDETQTKLENWAKFETKFPNTFKSMYQFWVCRNE